MRNVQANYRTCSYDVLVMSFARFSLCKRLMFHVKHLRRCYRGVLEIAVTPRAFVAVRSLRVLPY